MNNIVNYHVIDQTNIGDLVSAPTLYFDFPGYSVVRDDIRNVKLEDIKNKHIIVGGGGLVFSKFLNSFSQLSQQKKNTKLISWGIGQQIYDSYQPQDIKDFDYSQYTDGFDLVGIRDSHYKDNWVPCASCMHESFDKKREIKHDFVVFSHKKFQIKMDPFPRMTNSNQDLEEILDFLGSGETILTSSYHGAYWGTLLGRKVLSFPFTSKFHTFKHSPGIFPVEKWFQPVFKISLFKKTLFQSYDQKKFICNIDNWQSYLKDCQAYPEALSENRDRNQWYYSKIMNLLAGS
jgi:hypothetical protein